MEGARVLDLCKYGDRKLEERCMSIYRGKDKDGNPIEKGLAFPTCVSVNELVCHVSPLEADGETVSVVDSIGRIDWLIDSLIVMISVYIHK